VNILQAIDDREVFSAHFRGPTWDAWRAFLAALFALSMTAEQLALYQRCTGRSDAPTRPSHEAWLCIGRRGGKSFVLALIAVFLACFFDWRAYLGPGEVGTVMVVAADRRQARVIMRYVHGLLKAVPMLKRQIEGITRESITLKNNIVIEVHTASFRSTRGYTIVAALLDEIAYWPTDETSSEPDVEVVNAIRPGMATIPDAMLLCASSPYARKGALWSAFSRHHGKDGDPILVWQAATRTMNPSVPQSYIDQHMADDEARATAEYLAQFRADLEGYISREMLEACTPGYYALPPAAGTTYYGFVDAAGGSGGDAFAAAVSHREGERIVVDAVFERRPPFSPQAVIEELVPWLKSYRIYTVVGDRWAGGFPPEAFQKKGIRYEASKETKSDIYRTVLPKLMSSQVTLPRNDRLFLQLAQLERRCARGGHDSIDHPSGQHDDLANATMGAVLRAGTWGGYLAGWDDELFNAAWGDAGDLDAPARLTLQQSEAEKRYTDLVQRYGQPVSHLLMPRE
jgi:hypothetical protein